MVVLTQLCQWHLPLQTNPIHSSRDCQYQTNTHLQELHAQAGRLQCTKEHRCDLYIVLVPLVSRSSNSRKMGTSTTGTMNLIKVLQW